MNDFATDTSSQQVLDPYKRVNYFKGLVLGVDEFDQEQFYFLERDRLHVRSLHGYGTVCGLKVLVRDKAGAPEVLVAAGLAVAPSGQTIRVPQAQCADLNAWLDAHQDQVLERLGSPPLGDSLSLYVTLCYRECETDLVPAPSGPCRSAEANMQASRIADSFELRLSLDPPAQVEEEMVRRFGMLLGRIEITDAAETYLTREQMEDLVRHLAPKPDASPPEGDPLPGPEDRLYLHPQTARRILQAAFRVWVTEVRPACLKDVQYCTSGFADDACVLLARLSFDVSEEDDTLQVADGASQVSVRQDRRPVLLHTRLLQEWLALRGGRSGADSQTFATLFVQAEGLLAWIHHPVPLDIPLEAVTIEIDETDLGHPASVVSSASGLNVFALSLPGSPPPALAAGNRVEVSFDASLITELGSPVRPLLEALQDSPNGYLDRQGDHLLAYYVTEEQPPPEPPEPGVTILDDLDDVNVGAANVGDVLTLENGQWIAAPPPTGVTDLGDLADVNVGAANIGDVLTLENGQWVAAPSPAGVTDHGALSGLGDDDHPHYLLTNGTRSLTGDLSAGNNKITNLAQATTDGDALRFEQAVKVGDAAGGDLGGTYPDPSVIGLRGRRVRDVDPNPGDVLTWDGRRWMPAASQPLPFVTITRLDNRVYEIWFNIDAPDNAVEVVADPQALEPAIEVAMEINAAPFLRRINIERIEPRARNVFIAELAQESARLRFVFAINKIRLDNGEMVFEYAQLRNITFMGQDGRGTVTAFVPVPRV